jgi:hypothetical protein
MNDTDMIEREADRRDECIQNDNDNQVADIAIAVLQLEDGHGDELTKAAEKFLTVYIQKNTG